MSPSCAFALRCRIGLTGYVDINIMAPMSKPPEPAVRDHPAHPRPLPLPARQRAARALARRFDAAFRPLGLTSGQFSLLMSLNRPEPPTMGAVAALLAMDRTTLTAALKPLERRGLVRSTRTATTAAAAGWR